MIEQTIYMMFHVISIMFRTNICDICAILYCDVSHNIYVMFSAIYDVSHNICDVLCYYMMFCTMYNISHYICSVLSYI